MPNPSPHAAQETKPTRRSRVFLRSDAQGIVHDACINVGVDAGALSNGQWSSLVEIAEELLCEIHKIADGR